MSTIMLITTILGLIPSLVQAAESVYGMVKGNGEVKKDAVMTGVQNGLAIAASTGNDDAAKPEVQQAILSLASVAVDTVVTTLNTVKGWTNVQSDPSGIGR